MKRLFFLCLLFSLTLYRISISKDLQGNFEGQTPFGIDGVYGPTLARNTRADLPESQQNSGSLTKTHRTEDNLNLNYIKHPVHTKSDTIPYKGKISHQTASP